MWKSFYIKGAVGNNAFSYSKRGKDPQLFVPPLCEGGLELLKSGDKVVFSDEDEHGVLQLCCGLECELKTQLMGRPAVVVDNHNFVFYFWAEALLDRRFESGATLVHFDQHKDSRVPESLYRGESLDDALNYVHEVTHVGDYIYPAVERGWFSNVVNVTGESGLSQRIEGDFVLNIDLDFFAPELDYIPFERAQDFLRDHAKRAKFITVATSPFFIDQHRAIKKLRAIFDFSGGKNPERGEE